MILSSAIYESPRSWRSLGNRYTIYEDRVELEARVLFWRFVIPLEEIVSVGVFDKFVLRSNRTAVKIDLADLYRHVCLEKRGRWVKKIAFTPDDPERFVAALEGVRGGKD